MTGTELPHLAPDAINAVLHEHYLVLFAVDADPDTNTLTVWVAMEDAHIDRHITFDASSRKLPDDWQRKDAPTGLGTRTYTWAEQKAPEYDDYTWTDHTATTVQHAIGDALTQQGHNGRLLVAYVPTTPERVRDRLVARKAQHHALNANNDHAPGTNTGH